MNLHVSKPLVHTLGVVLASALLSGCGGGGSDSSTASTATTSATTAGTSTTTVTSTSTTATSTGATTATTTTETSGTGSTTASTSTGTSTTTTATTATTAGTTITTATATTTSTACDAAYVSNVLSAVSAFQTALGSSLTAASSYSASSYTTAQLNVYKTNWSNLPPGLLPFTRPGITLSQLSSASQIAAFNALARAALGAAGYTDLQGVLAADDYLGYTRNANGYGADLYRVAVVGTPSQTGTWTLMFGGHHLAFNLHFNQGCAYPTPHHIGVEPRTAFDANNHTSYSFYGSGTYQVLASKAAAMLAMFSAMNSSVLGSAFLSGQTFGDILIGPVEASTGSYAAVAAKFTAIANSNSRGVLVSSLSTAQQALVTAAIQQFTADYDSATAARLLAEYQAGYGSTYVAWANASGAASSSGPDLAANGTYVRIDGPRVWIEVAVQNGVVVNNQTHYHMMYRDKSYDYYNQLAN